MFLKYYYIQLSHASRDGDVKANPGPTWGRQQPSKQHLDCTSAENHLRGWGVLASLLGDF